MPRVISKLTLNQSLALVALVLGAVAVFANVSPGRTVTIHERELMTAVARGEDHVTPKELASWIIEGRVDYRLLDLRKPEAHAEYHVPTAENVPPASVGEYELARNEKIVLYSQGGIHAAQAWMLLRGKGYKSVYTLLGGLEGWRDEVVFPLKPENPTPEEEARFEEAVQVARFFGGQPRVARESGETQLLDLPSPQAGSMSVVAPVLPAAGGAPSRRRPREGC